VGAATIVLHIKPTAKPKVPDSTRIAPLPNKHHQDFYSITVRATPEWDQAAAIIFNDVRVLPDAAVGSNGRIATASAVIAVNTSSRLPACAVFTFDPRSHKIKLGIYMDRSISEKLDWPRVRLSITSNLQEHPTTVD
jgi:hypothetical protein